MKHDFIWIDDDTVTHIVDTDFIHRPRLATRCGKERTDYCSTWGPAVSVTCVRCMVSRGST